VTVALPKTIHLIMGVIFDVVVLVKISSLIRLFNALDRAVESNINDAVPT
jgi:hypothetical protein